MLQPAYLSRQDSAAINFGADGDITLTHVADTGLTVACAHANGTNLRLNNTATDGDTRVEFQLGGTTKWSARLRRRRFR